MFESLNPREKAILVGAAVRGSRPLMSIADSLKELALLADTAGIIVVGQTHQSMHQINPKTFIGAGKVEEIQEELSQKECNVVIFDDELSPRHQRELEKRFGEHIKVLDRSALILDIFAQHADTREGALQVELAQYEYRLPRLTRQWTHLARQAGGSGSRSGVGLRGPGETQLEADRRDIRRRISKLKQDLEQVRRHRRQYRARRARAGIPVIALVGYTNAGKSTLLNALADSDSYVADQLFATLDPTTRQIDLASGRQILITDTVGFIQKLPTSLIAAFRATLEEVAEADMLLHVVDSSHPNVSQQIEVVEDTLAELDIPPIPRILAWNKIDLCLTDDPPHKPGDSDDYAAQVQLSARDQLGLEQVLAEIENVLSSELFHTKLLVPYERGELVSLLFDIAQVERQTHTPEGIVMTVQLPFHLLDQLKDYQIRG